MSKALENFPERLFYRIGDVAEIVGVKPYVIRYWETEFPFLSPDKSLTGQRVFRRIDVENLLVIKKLLYTDRYSIEGARKKFMELRRSGEISETRAGVTQEVVATKSVVSAEAVAEVEQLAQELSSLVKKPSKDMFKF